MPPKELIVSLTKNRMEKLPSYGRHVPIKLRGGGHEYHAVMLNPAHSGSGYHGSGVNVAGAGVNVAGAGVNLAGMEGGKTNYLKLSKKVAGVASPLAMLAGPEALPVSAGLAAYAGSGKKAKKTKKGIDQAAQIAAILAASQGFDKEAQAMSQIGKVVGSGKKSKKAKKTVDTAAQIAAILGQTTGAMTPEQAAATSAIGSLIGQGIGELTGSVPDMTVPALPPRKAGKAKLAVSGGAHCGGGAHGPMKKKARFSLTATARSIIG